MAKEEIEEVKGYVSRLRGKASSLEKKLLAAPRQAGC